MRTAWIATGLLLAWVADVQGQLPNQRPAFSPYLNLNRRGANPAINYFGMVRPQLTAASSIYQLQQGQRALEQDQREGTVAGSELPPTGHSTGFLTHQRFFLNQGGRSPLSSRVAPAATVAPPPRRGR